MSRAYQETKVSLHYIHIDGHVYRVTIIDDPSSIDTVNIESGIITDVD